MKIARSRRDHKYSPNRYTVMPHVSALGLLMTVFINKTIEVTKTKGLIYYLFNRYSIHELIEFCVTQCYLFFLDLSNILIISSTLNSQTRSNSTLRRTGMSHIDFCPIIVMG